MSETAFGTKVVHVGFQACSLSEPGASVTTDATGSAPRPSRYIDFVDDGKLFEGHLTVQSRNLKSIIQYLVDQHAEQAIIIQDLQDQVSGLRAKVAKAGRSGAGFSRGGTGVGASPMELEEMSRRVKKVENFMRLWGVRAEDVQELVQSYGDPVVTPEQYTSYLLDLPCFQLTRREARALVVNAAANTITGGFAASAAAVAARDTAARRNQSQSGRSPAHPSGGDGEEKSAAQTKSTSSVAPAAGDGDEATAKKALEGVSEALRRIEELEWRQGGSGPGSVDTEARQGLEELGEFVTHRLRELESRTMLAASAASMGNAERLGSPPQATGVSPSQLRSLAERRAQKAAAQGDGSGTTAADPEVSREDEPPAPVASRSPPLPRERRDKRPRATHSSLSPGPEGSHKSGGPPPAGPAVDAIAREDAAASLQLVEMLEANVEKRFRELATQLANVAMRQGAAQGSSAPAAAAAEESGQPVPRAGSKQRGARRGVGAAATPSLPLPHAQPAAPAVTFTPPSGPVVDEAAREEVSALADKLADFEDDFGKRWQALEERLRIIGRATMNRAVAPNGALPASVDRKAREDASLSLMRLKQLERELAHLRRQLGVIVAAGGGGAGAASAALAAAGLSDGPAGGDGPLRVGAGLSATAALPPENLRDTYTSKIDSLEKEVEHRMAEVNRAIAILKEHDDTVGSAVARGGGGVPSPWQPALLHDPHIPTSPMPAAASTVVLHSTESAAVAAVVGAEEEEGEGRGAAGENPPTPSPPLSRLNAKQAADAERRRGTGPLSVLQLSSHATAQPGKGAAGLPAAAYPRRLTVSRLRSPDAPIFGSHLVVRNPVTDEELEAILSTANEAAAAVAAGRGDEMAARAAPEHPPSPLAAAVTTAGGAGKGAADDQRASAMDFPAAEARRASVPAASPPTSNEVGTSAIGHTTPCVVLNCAWCQSERASGRSRAAQVK